jgi:hypothetical protein
MLVALLIWYIFIFNKIKSNIFFKKAIFFLKKAIFFLKKAIFFLKKEYFFKKRIFELFKTFYKSELCIYINIISL